MSDVYLHFIKIMASLSHALAAFSVLIQWTRAVSIPSKPNILYLMSDDMRPQLGCYGHEYMHTPNLDALAQDGLR